MMTIRPSEQRGHFKNNWLDSYHTFSFGSYYDPKHMQFGALRVINQDVVSPNQGFDFHGHKDMEIFTYILSGVLEHQDSMGNKEQIHPGEVQIMSAGTGVLHSEYNPSAENPVELLQIWIMPEQYSLKPRYAQKNFSESEKLNQFKLVISPNEENGSLKIFQQAWVWSSIFTSGFEKSFSIQRGTKLWLQVANGEIEVDGRKLKKGDALGIEDQKSFNIKGIADKSEFLMLELA
jgi:redox-sensitive bicupin YhaK (pirin superfamily)